MNFHTSTRSSAGCSIRSSSCSSLIFFFFLSAKKSISSRSSRFPLNDKTEEEEECVCFEWWEVSSISDIKLGKSQKHCTSLSVFEWKLFRVNFRTKKESGWISIKEESSSFCHKFIFIERKREKVKKRERE